MNYANVSTNCTTKTVMIFSHSVVKRRCTTGFNSRLNASTKNQLLLSWKNQLKTLQCFLLQLFAQRQAQDFCYCSLQLNSGLFLMFVSMTCLDNLLSQICLINCALTSNCAAVYVIVSRKLWAFFCFHATYRIPNKMCIQIISEIFQFCLGTSYIFRWRE